MYPIGYEDELLDLKYNINDIFYINDYIREEKYSDKGEEEIYKVIVQDDVVLSDEMIDYLSKVNVNFAINILDSLIKKVDIKRFEHVLQFLPPPDQKWYISPSSPPLYISIIDFSIGWYIMRYILYVSDPNEIKSEILFKSKVMFQYIADKYSDMFNLQYIHIHSIHLPKGIGHSNLTEYIAADLQIYSIFKSASKEKLENEISRLAEFGYDLYYIGVFYVDGIIVNLIKYNAPIELINIFTSYATITNTNNINNTIPIEIPEGYTSLLSEDI